MGDLFGVLLTVVLLGGNAFFVAAEFALISARRDRLEALAAQGKRNANTVIRAGENLSMMLAAAQLGITICSILLGRVGEPAVAHLLEGPFELLGLPEQLLHPVAFALALTIVVILHILFGEMIPKNIALAGPERSALLLVPAHLMWLRLARPLIALYNLAANLSLRLLRIEPKDELEATVSTVELAEMIGESRSEGLLDEEEHRRLTQALGTSDRVVADVMVPRDATRSIRCAATGPRSATSSRLSPRPASPGSRCGPTTARWSATCTSRTCSTRSPTRAPAPARRSRAPISARCRRSA